MHWRIKPAFRFQALQGEVFVRILPVLPRGMAVKQSQDALTYAFLPTAGDPRSCICGDP